jgi:hypothetical protein
MWIANGGMPADAIVEVKPAPAPQNTPPATLGRRGGGILPNQTLSTNMTPITPMSSRTMLSGTTEASTQARQTPITAPGSITLTFQPSQSCRYHQTEIASCMIRIGSRIASACSGGMVRASSGVAAIPMPEKPPLARPTRSTAAIAVARKRGSLNKGYAVEVG